MSLEISNVSIILDDIKRINEVSFNLKQGELLGLIGPNGSGKSTLLKSIIGINPIDSGNITLNGINIENYDSQLIGQHLGYLEQHGEIHWPLKVDRLVALGRIPHLDTWSSLSNDDQQHIDKAMQQTDTLHLKDRIATTLSGGEKCRVLLARVLAGKPNILLVDEPTAALDPAHQLIVMNTLNQFVNDGGSVIIAIHDLSLASQYCHRLAMLDKGNLENIDAPEKVITQENLKKVYGINAEINTDINGNIRIHSFSLVNE